MVWCPHANTIFLLTVLFPLPLFASCNSTEQPSRPRGKSSHTPGAFPCTCACLHPFFRLMTAAEGLPAAFLFLNASLPVRHFSEDTGRAWVVSSKQDGSLPSSPWDQLTHPSLSCPLVGFNSKSPIHQCLQPDLPLPTPALCSIQLYPTPDALNHPHHLS